MEECIKLFGFWGTLFGLIFGIIGAYFSWNAWSESKQTKKLLEKEKERLNEKIDIILTDGKDEYPLPSLRRQDVTRSEIQGRLRAAQINPAAFYIISYLNDKDFFKQIGEIVEGSKSSSKSDLIIICTKEEFEVFNFTSPKAETKKPTARGRKPKNGK